MAKLIWAVLCETSIIDKQSNSVSLISVSEKITIEAKHDTEDSEDIAVLNIPVPLDQTLVTFLRRDDLEIPEKDVELITQIIGPKGDVVREIQHKIDLVESSKVRQIMHFREFSMKRGPGIYWFRTRLKSKSAKSSRWNTVSEIPFEVEIIVNGEPLVIGITAAQELSSA